VEVRVCSFSEVRVCSFNEVRVCSFIEVRVCSFSEVRVCTNFDTGESEVCTTSSPLTGQNTHTN
jgi:ethanolamine utilization protein EutQ (cupin superfamily)